MNWLTQTQGTINQYRPQMPGKQPVRVIHHMLLYMFQNTHPDFFKELLFQIQVGKVHQQLDFNFDESAIRLSNGKLRTPRVNLETKKIELPETFLSYLWGCTYAIYVLYLERINYPKVNRENGRTIHLTKQDNIDEAKSLFDYAKSLVSIYDEWDKQDLPNPEVYQAKDRNYVEQTNTFYTEAVKFIMCHEFTHLTKHAEKFSKDTSDDEILSFEKEADDDAIDLLKKGIPYDGSDVSIGHRLAIENGAVCGVIANFFLSPITAGKKHPNAEDRLSNVLEKLELDDEHNGWGLACIGLQLWDEQFGISLKWEDDFPTFKHLYYDLVKQIKEKQS
jgi:hypothetical protein